MSDPAATSTPTRTRRQQYVISGLALPEINRVLREIGLRLDQVDAIGQNPDIKGRRLTRVGMAINPSDAMMYGQFELSPFTTDDLAEGTTNLYFTDERVDDRINTLMVAGIGIAYTYDDNADTFTITVKLKANNGLAGDANGIYEKLKTGYGISVDADGLKLKQQAHIVDASTAHSITAPADAPADADALRDDLVANTVPAMQTALNNLGTKINAILAALETAEVFASS